MIHDGHEDIRGPQQELIRNFDALLDSLQNGIPKPHPATVDFMDQLRDAASTPGNTFGSGPDVMRLVMEVVPPPPEHMRAKIVTLRSEWLRLKDAFSGNNSEVIKEKMPAISK